MQPPTYGRDIYKVGFFFNALASREGDRCEGKHGSINLIAPNVSHAITLAVRIWGLDIVICTKVSVEYSYNMIRIKSL